MTAKRRRLRENAISYGFVLPYLVLFALFTVVPVVWAMVLSFTNYNIIQPAAFTGLDNYVKLFLTDEVFQTALKNTLVIAFVCGPLGYIACLLIAWLLADLPPKLRAFLTLLFYAPSISGSVYIIWSFIFSSDSYGFMNATLEALGLIRDPVQWLQDPATILGVVILVQVWMSLGTSFLTFIAALQGIDRSLYEAGTVDGIRNRWQELWYITLPTIRPMLMFGALMQITTAFSVGDVSNNLAGFPSVDYAAHTIVTHMQDFGSVRFELGYSCAIATFLFLLMMVTNSLIQQILKSVGE